MGWCRAVVLVLPVLLAVLASQIVRQGSYYGPPFHTVPVWDAPSIRGDDHDGSALEEILRRALGHGTPVIVRGGVRHWRSVESALYLSMSCLCAHSMHDGSLQLQV